MYQQKLDFLEIYLLVVSWEVRLVELELTGFHYSGHFQS